MPSEVRQRKKPQKPDDETETTQANGQDKECKVKTSAGGERRVVLQQNQRFSELEEKFNHLHFKYAPLISMEDELQTVSKKLAASEDDLQVALSTVSMATGLKQDVAALHATVTAIQADEQSASHDLQEVNAHFLNVTETWQQHLGLINSDLVTLKTESRNAHAEATERVNEAERRAKALEERLEELEDSTKRNSRALERTEGDDVKRAQDHLDWNNKQIQKLKHQIDSLTQRESELSSQLQEHIPKAEECEEHLPKVEEAVRSIVRLASDLSAAEKRLEELTLQVFGTEDSMLKALNEILHIRQELDTIHAKNSILKMKDELTVVKEAVRELSMVLKQNREESESEPDRPEDVEEWTNEEDELWEPEETDNLTE